MSRRPRVSFILPIFNAAPYLAETLASLFAQTFEDFEIIAINDGSTDGTSEILHSPADTRLRVIERANHGLVATLNEAVSLASAEYLARIDADDICLPLRLATQIAFLDSNPEVAVVGSAIETFTSNQIVPARVIAYPPDPTAPLLFRNALAHPAVMMRKSVLDAHHLRYEKLYRCSQDYDLWCQCAAAKIKISNLPDVLIRYRLHAKQITQEFAEDSQIESEAIRSQLLHRLGIHPTSAQCALHNAIARDRFTASSDFVNAAAAWLADLATRPAMLAMFESDALLRVLTGRYVTLARFARASRLSLNAADSAIFADYIHPEALD